MPENHIKWKPGEREQIAREVKRFNAKVEREAKKAGNIVPPKMETADIRKMIKSRADFNAFKKLDKRFSFCGVLAFLIPVIICPYYSVIGGWVTKYCYVFLSGSGHASAQPEYFGDFIAHPFEPILWFTVFIGITALAVLSTSFKVFMMEM